MAEPAESSDSRKKKSEVVADEIREFIIREKLRPGDRLPTEHELAEMFNVSRISVREATKALGFLGIIDAAPRRGLTVGKLNMSRLSKYIGFHFAIAGYSGPELVKTRLIIETGVMPRVAKRFAEHPELYRELRDLSEEMIRHWDDIELFTQLDRKFHFRMVEISGIPALLAFVELLSIFFHDAPPPGTVPVELYLPAAKEHLQIVEFLRDQEIESASELLRTHISHRFKRHPPGRKAPVSESESV